MTGMQITRGEASRGLTYVIRISLITTLALSATSQVMGAGHPQSRSPSSPTGAQAAGPHDLLREAAAVLERGDLEQAERLIRALLQKDSRSLAAHSLLAIVLVRRGQVQEAEATLQRALKIDPAYVPALVNLGNLYLETGRSKEAATEFAAVVRIDDGNAAAEAGWGAACIAQGQVDGALTHYERAHAIEPRNPRFVIALVDALLKAAQLNVRGSSAVKSPRRRRHLPRFWSLWPGC